MRNGKQELVTHEMLNRRLHEAELTIQEFLQFHEELAQEFDANLQDASTQSRYICSRARRFIQQYRTLRLLQLDDLALGMRKLQPVALEPLIQEVVEIFAPTLSRRELTVDLKLDPASALALPPDQLQALIHLMLENAIRFSRLGTITIRVESTADNLDLLVCDQGAGLDRNLLRRLFDDDACELGEEDIPPSAIGLWLTKALVERLGASWEVHTDLDRGTEVKVRFGKGPHHSGIETLPLSPTEPPRQSQKPRVLVVDDDRFTLNLINLHLTQNFEPLLAQDGAQALEKLRREPVDLVLLDLRMPDLDGIDVLSEIRELYSETEMPVIFLTVESQAHALARLIELGGNDYLVKPVNSEELVTKLRYHFNQARQFKDLRRDSASLDRAIRNIETHNAQIQRSLPIIAQLSLNVETPLLVFNGNMEVLFASIPALHCLKQSEAESNSSSLEDVIPLGWKSIYALVQKMGACLGFRLHLIDSSLGESFEFECLLYPTPQGGALRLPQGFEPPDWAHCAIQTGRVYRLDPLPPALEWPLFDATQETLELSFDGGLSARFVGRSSLHPLQSDPAQLAAELMQLCLQAWEEATGKNKFDLAEESGLWSASVDKKGTYRTKTLDRYLKASKVPANPRVQTLEKTAQFVLAHCTSGAPQTCEQLSQTLERLQQHFR